MVEVWLPYGNTEICARIPTENYLGTLIPQNGAPLSNLKESLEYALSNPEGVEKTEGLIKHGRNVAIAIDGNLNQQIITTILLTLFEKFIDAGVSKSDITVIICFRPNKEIEKLSEDLHDRVIYHDYESEDNIHIGGTRYGTRLYVNRVFYEADTKIVIGRVILHPFAGFTGGRELILPGISGLKTIRNNHSLLIREDARAGNLENNPVHEDMMEAASKVGVDLCVSLGLNFRGVPLKIVCGDLEKSYYEMVNYVKKLIFVPIERKAEILIVSPGGEAEDYTLSNSVKSLIYAEEALRKEGSILLTAECSMGYGDENFYSWSQKFTDVKSLEKAIRRNYALGGEYAYYLSKIKSRARVLLVSALPEIYSKQVFGIETVRSINKGLKEMLAQLGRRSKVAVIPYGNSTLPLVNSGKGRGN